ncbi:hypothetical protein Fmac_005795 [Flemingia macrophylla]|uniref:Uncharacterized protein n=1 Tax=Flemingia macrophylla TaxID=520843 RepID=A0ABD1NBK8_9FABA
MGAKSSGKNLSRMTSRLEEQRMLTIRTMTLTVIRSCTDPSSSFRRIFPHKRNQVRTTKKIASATPQEERDCGTTDGP